MAKSISSKAITEMINYYYLVSFCPPGHLGELKKTGQKLRAKLAKGAGLKAKEFTDLAFPEIARRIVTFQQATRKPEAEAIKELAGVLKGAEGKTEKAAAFQAGMRKAAAHPGRAKAANRLHRQKGCGLCITPCLYGYFTLMSEPDFKSLEAILDAENQKPARERDPISALWAYTREHLWKVLGAQGGYIHAYHLGNLSYCLLMLGMAKSRFPMSEEHLGIYQLVNQRAIRGLGATPIDLTPPG